MGSRRLRRITAPCLDCSAASFEGSAALAMLSLAASRGLRLEGLPDGIAAGVGETTRHAETPSAAGHTDDPGFLESVGRKVASDFTNLRETLEFLGRTVIQLLAALFHPSTHPCRGFASIFARIGADAVPVTLLIGLLLGVILAFESAGPLQMFGAEVYVANLMGVAVVRELGVLVAAIVMAGRTASAYAAEIGTMSVNDEINAMHAMGIDPVDYLVVPRVFASALSLPLLAVFASLAGIAGGYFVLALYGYSLPVYWEHAASFCHAKDVVASLFKSALFGFLIGGVGCHRGLRTGGGADAVGQSTTGAVVGAIILYAIADGVCAVVFQALGI